VARERFLPVNVALGLRKGSVIKAAVDRQLVKLKEAGLVTIMIPLTFIIIIRYC